MVKVEESNYHEGGEGSRGETLPGHDGHSPGEDESTLVSASLALLAESGDLADTVEAEPVSSVSNQADHQVGILDTPEGRALAQHIREELQAEFQQRVEQMVSARVAEIMRHTKHDLRTPITNFSTRLYLMRRIMENISPHYNGESLQQLMHHLDVLNRSVGTFADALDFETDNLYEAHYQEIHSEELLNHLSDRYRQSGVLNNRVKLVWVFPKKDVSFRCDEDKVKSMLHILIDNALKFTSLGTIHVMLAVSNHEITIQVADTGCGIRKSQLLKIFEEGVSLPQEETPAVPGSPPATGLGLYYVKRFCEALGGAVTVESEYRHQTVFTITLPRQSGAELPT